MPTPVEFILRMVDRVSPVSARVQAALRGVDAAARAVGRGGGKALGGVEAALGGVARAAVLTGSRLGGLARGGLVAVSSGLGRIGRVGALAVGGLAAVGVAGLASVGKMSFDAQRFKQDALAAMKILLKSGGAAQRAADMAMRTASEIGRGPGEVLGQFVDLLAKGFSTKKVDEIVRSLADLSVVDPRANMDSLSRTIGQIAAKGKLQGEEILQLSEAGLEAGAVYDALAKKLGVTRDAAQKMITAGKVSSTVAVDAILGAISSQTGGGKVGAVAAQRAVSTVSGQIDAIKGKFEALMIGADGGGAGGMGKMLTALSAALDSRAAESLASAIASIGTAAAGLFEGVGEAEIERVMKTLATFAKQAAAGVSQLVVLGRALGSGMGEGLDYAADAMQALGLTASTSKAPLASLSQVFRVLGIAIGGVIAVATTLPMLFARALQGIETAIQFVASGKVTTLAVQLGMSIVNGIVGGIKAGAAAVTSAVSGVAQGAIDTAKSVLKIRSPSQVMHEIGVYTVEGFAGGVAANATMASAAMGQVVEPPRVAGAVGAQSMGGVTINVTVELADGDERSARAAGEAIATTVRRELASVLESMAASQVAA